MAKPTTEESPLIKAICSIIKLEKLGMTVIYLGWDGKIDNAYICSANALDMYVETLIYEKEKFDNLSEKEVQCLMDGIVFVKGQLEI